MLILSRAEPELEAKLRLLLIPAEGESKPKENAAPFFAQRGRRRPKEKWKAGLNWS